MKKITGALLLCGAVAGLLVVRAAAAQSEKGAWADAEQVESAFRFTCAAGALSVILRTVPDEPRIGIETLTENSQLHSAGRLIDAGRISSTGPVLLVRPSAGGAALRRYDNTARALVPVAQLSNGAEEPLALIDLDRDDNDELLTIDREEGALVARSVADGVLSSPRRLAPLPRGISKYDHLKLDLSFDGHSDLVLREPRAERLWLVLTLADGPAVFEARGYTLCPLASDDAEGACREGTTPNLAVGARALHDLLAWIQYPAFSLVLPATDDPSLTSEHMFKKLSRFQPALHASDDENPDTFLYTDRFEQIQSYIRLTHVHDLRIQNWQKFPVGYSPARILAGDFDGNGLDDLLLPSSGGRTWWFGLTRNEAAHGYEQVLALPPVDQLLATIVVDLNDDGLDDLIVDSGDSLSAAFLSAKPASNSVRIDAVEGEAAYDASSSTLRITCALGGTAAVRIENVSPQAVYVAGAIRYGGGGGAELLLRERYIEPSMHRPAPCVGFNRINSGPWGWIAPLAACPAHHAVYANDDPSHKIISPQVSDAIRVTCCPLPAEDILLDDHLPADKTCPEDYVVTGFMSDSADESKLMLRCTKINRARYQLDEPSPAHYWGSGLSWTEKESWLGGSALPVAIRHALGRYAFRGWDADGCIGSPPGSLLVGIGTSNCRTWPYRQLLFSGAGEDIRGVTVEMFPDCSRLDTAFRPDPKCE